MSSADNSVVGDDSQYSGGVAQTSNKAKIAAILSAVGSFLVAWAVSYFTGGNDVDWNTLWAAIASAIVVGAPTGAATYATKNHAIRRRHI